METSTEKKKAELDNKLKQIALETKICDTEEEVLKLKTRSKCLENRRDEGILEKHRSNVENIRQKHLVAMAAVESRKEDYKQVSDIMIPA